MIGTSRHGRGQGIDSELCGEFPLARAQGKCQCPAKGWQEPLRNVERTSQLMFIQRSSVVERATVNRLVVGSNPTAGAIAQKSPKLASLRHRLPYSAGNL